jgi:hypothetical protein
MKKMNEETKALALTTNTKTIKSLPVKTGVRAGPGNAGGGAGR